MPHFSNEMALKSEILGTAPSVVTKLLLWFTSSQAQAKPRPGFLACLWVEVNRFALAMHSGCLAGQQVCTTPAASSSNAPHIAKIRLLRFPGGDSAAQPAPSLRVGSPTTELASQHEPGTHGVVEAHMPLLLA